MANVHEAPDRIYIVGMMGCGKTTVGRLLAEQLEYPFVDLDDAIEARAHASIAEIFERHGEFNFRACEAQVLRDLPRRYPIGVVATGGGTPMHFKNMKFLSDTGLSIFLDIDEEHLVARLADQREKRPLLNRDDWKTFLADLTSERRSTYEQAEVQVDVSEGKSENAVAAILKQLPQITGH